jgi:hypothetical protein
MPSSEVDRIALANGLLDSSAPLGEIIAQLVMVQWDYEGDGVELTRQQVVRALQRYVRGELSGSEIEVLENAIEGRIDVYFEHDFKQHIQGVVHALANPLWLQPLEHTRAKYLLEQLVAP